MELAAALLASFLLRLVIEQRTIAEVGAAITRRLKLFVYEATGILRGTLR
jgi:hypothetical protein